MNNDGINNNNIASHSLKHVCL